MSDRGNVTPGAGRSAASLGARFIAMVVLAAGVQLWFNHHLGLSSETPWVALVLGTLSGVLGAAAQLLHKAELTRLAAWLRAPARWVLHPAVLGVLWGLALVGGLFVSSVMVIPDAAAKGRAILCSVERTSPPQPCTDQRADSPQRDLAAGLARFPVLTSPFGRPYRLAVPGFLEETVSVYPFVGLKITPDRDLRRSPSVLFRPSSEGIRALNSGGTFTVVARTPVAGQADRIDVIVAEQKAPAGALLVGRAQPVSPASAVMWPLELDSIGADPSLRAKMLLAWSNVTVLEPLQPIRSGTVLVAEIRTPQRVVVSRKDVTVGSEPLVDAALVDAGN
jgi:hypothetical protein